MCSISGFTWNDLDLIKAMNKILSYRGPDDTGVYLDDKISLGHNRLSIIDLSKAGHQPMSNNDKKLWIVYNGEVYNYLEIRRTLEKKGYRFNSNTDTEVILKAYEEYGEQCLKMFNGMFAFAIWDMRNNTLFIARDRIGIKPLYYYYKNENLIFSSEMKAILLHDIKKEIEIQSLNSFLTYRFIPSNKTMVKGIKKLMPGYYMKLNAGKLEIKKYWDMVWEIENKPENYYLNLLNKLLKNSVEMRLKSDVPLGAYLSGGIDSSLVVAINSQLRETPVETFTVGYGHETDEFKYARIISDYLSTNHHEIILDYKEIAKSLPTIVWHMDEPHSEVTMIPLYFLSEYSKKIVTVVNTGEGADEIFSGYPYYYPGSYMFKPIPKFIKSKFYLWYYPPFKQNERKEIFLNKIKDDNTLNWFLNGKQSKNLPDEFLNRILLFDIKHELTNWELNRTDKMTMAFSMEARVPFLDHRIVELCSKLPIRYKQPNFIGKYILKKLALSYLPKEIVLRKKQGFTTPEHSWIKYALEDKFEEIFLNNKKPFLNYDFIKKLIYKHKLSAQQKRFQRYSFQLLSLLFFDLWYEIFINNTNIRDLEQLLSI